MLIQIEKVVYRVVEEITAVFFVAMILTTFFAVIGRDLLQMSAPWSTDAVRYLMIWAVYLGVAVLSARNDHITVDVFYGRMAEKSRRVIDVLIALLGLVLCGYAAYFSWNITYTAIVQGQMSMSTYIPAAAGYMAVPAGFGLSALGYLIFLPLRLRGKMGGHETTGSDDTDIGTEG